MTCSERTQQFDTTVTQATTREEHSPAKMTTWQDKITSKGVSRWEMKALAIWLPLLLALSGCMQPSEDSLPASHAFTPAEKAPTFSTSKGYGVSEEGILYFDYAERYNQLGKYPNPTFIAAYANALYRDYLEGNREARPQFFRQIDYLMDVASEDELGRHYWPFPFENHHFDAPPGWRSAMTSGRILGILSRAHALSGREKYLDFAATVFDKLSAPIIDGGMTTYMEDGSAWLEEVAYPGAESFKILNGHIFALAGLYDYANYTGNQDAESLTDAAILAVQAKLQDFDAGYISYYSESIPSKSLRSFAARNDYNTIHVSQLLYLFELSKEPEFLVYAQKFYQYESEYGEMSASHSTNEASHGPEKMNLTFGNNYWSSYSFPVTVQIDFGKMILLDGLVILGHTQASTPSDFLVATSQNGKDWQGVARQKNNSVQRKQIDFTYSVPAQYLRLEIDSDNGNGAVALDGIGLIRRDISAPLINFCNFSVSFRKINDGDPDTRMPVRCPGWLLIPGTGNYSKITLIAQFTGKPPVVLQGSDDLISWNNLDAGIEADETRLVIAFEPTGHQWLRLKFDTEISSIAEFSVD